MRVDAGLPPSRLGDHVRLAAKSGELTALWRLPDTRPARGSFASASSSDGGRTWRRIDAADTQGMETRRVIVPGQYPGTLHALRRTGSDGATELHYIASADDGKTWWVAIKLGSGDIRNSALEMTEGFVQRTASKPAARGAKLRGERGLQSGVHHFPAGPRT